MTSQRITRCFCTGSLACVLLASTGGVTLARSRISAENEISSVGRHEVHLPPDGRAAITLDSTTVKVERDYFTAMFVGQSYSVRETNEYKVVLEKSGGFWLSVLAGSRFNSTAYYRITLSILQVGESVKIYADVGAVTNPGSAFEKVTNLNGGKGAKQVQEIFDNELANRSKRVARSRIAASDTSLVKRDSTAILDSEKH